MLAPSRKYKGKTYRYPRLTVNMTDLDVIERAAALIGCKVQVLPVQPGRLPAFRATRVGSAAAALMRELRPLMGERRRAQIDAALA